MAGRELPYDPYIPSGGSGQGGSAGYEGGNTRTAAIQSVRANILWDHGGARSAMGGRAGFPGAGPRCLRSPRACTLMGKTTFEGGKARNGTVPRHCER